MSDTPTFWSKWATPQVTRTRQRMAEVVAEAEAQQRYMKHMAGLIAPHVLDRTSQTKPPAYLHAPRLGFGWTHRRVQVEQRGPQFELTVSSWFIANSALYSDPLPARVISVPTALAPALDHWLPHQGFWVPMAVAMVESWERLGDAGVEQIILATARLNAFTRPAPHVVVEPCDDHRGPLALIAVAVSIRPNAPPRTAHAFGAPQREATVLLAA